MKECVVFELLWIFLILFLKFPGFDNSFYKYRFVIFVIVISWQMKLEGMVLLASRNSNDLRAFKEQFIYLSDSEKQVFIALLNLGGLEVSKEWKGRS